MNVSFFGCSPKTSDASEILSVIAEEAASKRRKGELVRNINADGSVEEVWLY